jgi:hypothetical protein
MQVVFTYLPIRLKEVTEIYLKYSIKSLNEFGVIPIVYSDINYFENTGLNYDWIEFDVDVRYKKDLLWSYPKLKVLSNISYPFIHLDNDLIVSDFIKFKSTIDDSRLNIAYKHQLTNQQIETFNEIYKIYSGTPLNFDELNNTSIIAATDYVRINQTYVDVLNVIDLNYDFFTKRYNSVPPITLNQQCLNLHFNNINYLFNENPTYEKLNDNGVCHMAEKNIVSSFILNRNLI